MATIWEEWYCYFRENSCDRCRGLHGQLFRKGEGPQPPLHNGCTCQRIAHHTEIVDAAEHVKLSNPPGERWADVVIAEISGMVDHSAIEGEEGEPNWRGVTR